MSASDNAGTDLWKAAVAGIAGGLAASLAMDLFQSALSRLSGSGDDGEPATEQAADRVSEAVTGAPVPADRKPLAGQAVNYATGAALGLAYGYVVEVAPPASVGRGAGFGLVTAGLLDEATVSLAGMGDPPRRTPLATHADTLSSHLVFGMVAEGVRRITLRILSRPDTLSTSGRRPHRGEL